MVVSIMEVTVIAVVIIGVLFLGPKYIPKIARNWRRAAKETAQEVAQKEN